MAKWNADKPAVGNQISADIPDIEENFQELHDVITAITNGTLGTTTAANFMVDAGTTPLIWLKDSRARFEWKDADEIYIHAGAYHHVGTVSQVVYWSSKLTSDIGSPDASKYYYLYIDDTAVVTLGTNLLTTDELLWSSTAPAWSEAKHGWYSGDDKCIFAVYSDSGSEIETFWHDGGDYLGFDTYVTDDEGSASQSFTAASLTIPGFSTKAQVIGRLDYSSASSQMYLRTTGSAQTHANYMGTVTSGCTYSASSLPIMTDTSQQIDIYITGTVTWKLYTHGWYFPTGM